MFKEGFRYNCKSPCIYLSNRCISELGMKENNIAVCRARQADLQALSTPEV